MSGCFDFFAIKRKFVVPVHWAGTFLIKYKFINAELLFCFTFSFAPFEIPKSIPLLERYYMYLDGGACGEICA